VSALRPEPDGELLAALTARIAARTTRELDPVELAGAGLGSQEALGKALETLAEGGQVDRVVKWVCPETNCGRPLAEADRSANLCPHCQIDFRETGEEPIARTIYSISGELSRDIEWMIVIHGMNTLGPWQEELSWRLSNKFRYSAPVHIYKYGLVRLGVLLRFQHRQLVRALGHRVRRAAGFAAEFRRKRAPDVILHSFGTLLFARLLDDPEFADLRFGRVILAGSIVRPDHKWARHLETGRVEAILNHCGDEDRIVELANPFIPGSGPSGRRGLRDPRAYSVVAPGYNHSTFFEDRGLSENLAHDGVWDRFLRLPLNTFEGARMGPDAAAHWRPLFPVVQPVLAILVLLIVVGVIGVLLAGLVCLGATWLGPR